jgi:hypothetical protein
MKTDARRTAMRGTKKRAPAAVVRIGARWVAVGGILTMILNFD